MTLQQEFNYWRRWARDGKTDAWLIALGVAYGLQIALSDHGKEITRIVQRKLAR